MGKSNARALRRNESAAASVETADPAIRLGRLQHAVGFNLRLAQEASFRAFGKRVGDRNLKPRRYAILTIIHENPGLTQAELGRGSGREKSSITPAVRDLVRRRLVIRRSCPDDGRVYRLWLTRNGTSLVDRLAREAKMHDQFIEAAIGSANRDQLIRLLGRIERVCSEFAAES